MSMKFPRSFCYVENLIFEKLFLCSSKQRLKISRKRHQDSFRSPIQSIYSSEIIQRNVFEMEQEKLNYKTVERPMKSLNHEVKKEREVYTMDLKNLQIVGILRYSVFNVVEFQYQKRYILKKNFVIKWCAIFFKLSDFQRFLGCMVTTKVKINRNLKKLISHILEINLKYKVAKKSQISTGNVLKNHKINQIKNDEHVLSEIEREFQDKFRRNNKGILICTFIVFLI